MLLGKLSATIVDTKMYAMMDLLEPIHTSKFGGCVCYSNEINQIPKVKLSE